MILKAFSKLELFKKLPVNKEPSKTPTRGDALSISSNASIIMTTNGVIYLIWQLAPLVVVTGVVCVMATGFGTYSILKKPDVAWVQKLIAFDK